MKHTIIFISIILNIVVFLVHKNIFAFIAAMLVLMVGILSEIMRILTNFCFSKQNNGAIDLPVGFKFNQLGKLNDYKSLEAGTKVKAVIKISYPEKRTFNVFTDFLVRVDEPCIFRFADDGSKLLKNHEVIYWEKKDEKNNS